MKSYWKLFTIEAKLFLREPNAFFFTLVFPLMLLFIFGGIYGNTPSHFFGDKGSVDVSVPAYIAMIIGIVGLMSISINISEYKEKGILRRYQASTLKPQVLLLANISVYLFMTLLGVFLLVVAGKIFYNLKFEGNILFVLTGFIISTMSFFTLGFLIAGLSRTVRNAQIAGMILYFPMIFFSGATIPREILPATIRSIGRFLPMTYVVDLLRGLWAGEAWNMHILNVSVLLSVFFL
jgi:ABC-2 type transport system permease protein